MATINSGYGQGTSFTNVQGPSGMDVSPFLMALLQAEQRHLAGKVNRGSNLSGTSGSPNRMVRSQRPSSGREGDRSGAMSEQMAKAQVAKAKAEAKALSSRIPTRLHPGGAGYMGAFSTPDHLAMTGAQRAVFLPNNAQQIGGIGELSPEDQDFLIRMRSSRGAR